MKEQWDCISDSYYAKEYENTNTIEMLKESPENAFPTKVYGNIRKRFLDLHGVKVCIPSSGDNIAAFAFYLLGADVTSCDISSEQIKNASHIADEQGWSINFKVCDSMDLSGVDSKKYDLVYTSNGVHVWISDLEQMYKSFRRVLKDDGQYIFFETHPFIRPFDDSTNELKVIKPYDEIGPFGEVPNYLWRIQDFVNALIKSGFSIECVDEMFSEKTALGSSWWKISEWDEKSNWHINPYAALPQWISLCAIKQD